ASPGGAGWGGPGVGIDRSERHHRAGLGLRGARRCVLRGWWRIGRPELALLSFHREEPPCAGSRERVGGFRLVLKRTGGANPSARRPALGGSSPRGAGEARQGLFPLASLGSGWWLEGTLEAKRSAGGKEKPRGGPGRGSAILAAILGGQLSPRE